MNTTRHGKIARLSKALRTELNRRLADGATGRSLVEWLNAQPEVKAMVEREFGGHPIREQNLSQWKSGGYRDWQQQQEALELMSSLQEGAEELTAGAEDRAPASDVLAVWLTARYSVATREIARARGEKRWKLLRQMCADVLWSASDSSRSTRRSRCCGGRTTAGKRESPGRAARKICPASRRK